MPPNNTPAASLTLHSWARSSCSCRLRIALAHKQIPYELVDVDYSQKAHQTAEYTRLNPSRSVPTLVVRRPQPDDPAADWSEVSIGQSVAALEYLEEGFPAARIKLLPAQQASLGDRALVRTLVQVVVADTQPPTNSRVLDLAAEMGVADTEAWCRRVAGRGIGVYEELIRGRAGRYSVGDEVTMADVCLVPALWNALGRWGMELGRWPTVERVFGNLMELEAFSGEDWRGEKEKEEEEA